MPKLSVISINLNNANGLSRTLEGIITQTWKDFELIVIDGGSTDNSIEIIKKFKQNIAFWVSEPDKGIYNAMNKGIKVASGEYCYFLNSGDYLVNEHVFQKIFEPEPKGDILFGNLIVTLNNKRAGVAKGKNTLTFSDVYNHTVKHQASFIKRQLFEQYGFYNEELKIIADWEFFIKTLGLGNVSYKHIDLNIAFFNNEGISNKNPKLCQTERTKVINAFVPKTMQPDYEFLRTFGRYKKLYFNPISFFMIRLLSKIFR